MGSPRKPLPEVLKEIEAAAEAAFTKAAASPAGPVIAAERQESLDRHGEPFAGIEPAPEEFHSMWEHRSDFRI